MALGERVEWVRPGGVLAFPRMPPWMARNFPAIVLVLASITYAEFLTGSTVVLSALIDPVSLLFLLGLYGAGVLLVREASVRWSKGWPTVLLLGAAYGIAEEGIGTKTFFGPAGVGYLAIYGHWLGVNWVWAVELALFHAIFSIALPIATVALLFPATQGRSFLATPRARTAALLAFLATVGAMFVLFNRPETPSALLILAALAAVGVLVVGARRGPAHLGGLGLRAAPTGVRHPFLAGAAFVWGFFAIVWLLPRFVPFPWVVIAATIGWTVGFGVWCARHRDELGDPRTRADVVFGSLTFSFVLAMVVGVFGDFAVFPVLAAVVGGFLLLRARLKTPGGAPRTAPSASADGSAAVPSSIRV
jgi:hypothetical protein